jgi:hypothetical protein
MSVGALCRRAGRLIGAFFKFAPARASLLFASLALVMVFFIVVGSLIEHIYLAEPPGMTVKGRYITLAARSSGGAFVGAQARDLDALEAKVGTGRLLRYAVERYPVKEEGIARQRVVAFVEPTFLRHIGPSLQAGRIFEPGERAAVVSGAYAKHRFGGVRSALDRSIKFEGGGALYRIVGVAVDEFRGVNAEDVDMLLDARWRSDHVSIQLPGIPVTEEMQEGLRRLISAEFPVFGFLRLEHPGERAALESLYRASDHGPTRLQIGNMTLELAMDQGRRLTIVDGIDLDPDRRGIIKRYTRYLSALCLVMAVVFLFNYALHLLAMLPTRLDEIRLRIVVGAGTWDLSRRMFFEQAWIIPAAMAIALPFAIFSLRWIQGVPEFGTKDGATPLEPRMLTIGVSVLVLFSLQALASAAPLLSIRRLMTAGGSVSESAGQRFIRSGAGVIAFFVCFTAASTVLLMSMQVQRMRSTPIGVLDRYVGEMAGEERLTIADARARVGGRAFAFADAQPLAALGLQKGVRLPQSTDAPRIMAYSVKVSSDWPSLSGLRLLAGDVSGWCETGRVLIGAAAAKQLGIAAGRLIGQPIVDTEGEESARRRWVIHGVVGDVRYDRLYGDHPVVLYTCGEAKAFTAGADGFVTFSSPWYPQYALSPNADGWDRLDVRNFTRLSIILNRRTALERFLALSASLASMVALVLAFIGLGADSVSLIHARRREIALRLCLGATRGVLVTGLLRERLRSMAAAAALAAVLLALLHPSLEDTLPWYRPTDLMAIAAATVVMMVSVLIGLAVLLRVNIKPDLAEELRRER